MKAILFFISFFLLAEPSYSEKIEKLRFPKTLTTLTLSASSDFSYEDAVNRFTRMKPDGYVIESIKYIRGKNYTVLVTLRKVS